MVEVICEICATAFKVKPYRAGKARFCSFKCGGRWHMANRAMPNGHKVGNQWRKGLRPANAFTREQAIALSTVEGERHDCAQCGTNFELKPWLARQNKSKSGLRFCSKDCHGAFKREKQSGPLAADYVGGITTYRGKGWLEARAAAVERDGGICQECGRVVGKSISVHHKRPFRLYKSAAEANNLTNLVCLCQSCHMKIEHHAAAPNRSACR